MRNDWHFGIEAGIKDIGERHAAHLADDLPGDFDAGKQNHHAQAKHDADEQFAADPDGVNRYVLRHLQARRELQRRDDQSEGKCKQGPNLPRDFRGAEQGRCHDQATTCASTKVKVMNGLIKRGDIVC